MQVEPIDLNGLVAILIGGAIVLTPLFAYLVKSALKPLLDGLIRLRETTDNQEVALLRRRVALLERRVAELDGKQLQLVDLETLPTDGERRLTRERA
jgi:hypothetical protein